MRLFTSYLFRYVFLRFIKSIRRKFYHLTLRTEEFTSEVYQWRKISHIIPLPSFSIEMSPVQTVCDGVRSISSNYHYSVHKNYTTLFLPWSRDSRRRGIRYFGHVSKIFLSLTSCKICRTLVIRSFGTFSIFSSFRNLYHSRFSTGSSVLIIYIINTRSFLFFIDPFLIR